MPALKLGIALSLMPYSFKAALPRLAEWQVHTIELDARQAFRPADFGPSAIRQLRKQLDDHLLRVSCVSYPTRRGFTSEQELEARVAGTKAALKFASELGARRVVAPLGLIPDDLDSPTATLLIQVLTDLGLYGQRIGSMLCAATGPQAAANYANLLSRLPDGLLALELNPGLLAINGHESLQFVKELGQHIQIVHVNDAQRGFGGARGEWVELGDGQISWPEHLGLLQEHDYRGDFVINHVATTDADSELQTALKYLRGL
jgi:sugar phosphate isomerase/epimerase